jgi:Transglutaminase-like superfamily
MVTVFRSVRRRAPSEWRLFAHAVLLHGIVVVLCRTLSYGRVARWLDRAYPERAGADGFDPSNVHDAGITWATATAAYWWPSDGTCLSAALTARCLLRRAGRKADVRFGVAVDRASANGFAHAWVESCDRPVSGYRPADFLVLEHGR